MTGVRAEIAVHGPANCPVTQLSAESDTAISDVTWAQTDGVFTEEFRVDKAVAEANAASVADADPIVEVGDEQVYRFDRGADHECACSVVESLGNPLADVRVASSTTSPIGSRCAISSTRPPTGRPRPTGPSSTVAG
jgi:hypothetical protein